MLSLYKVWMKLIAKIIFEIEVIHRKGFKAVWNSQSVLDGKPCHCPAAAFGIHGNSLELKALIHKEQRLHDTHFLFNTLPVAHALKLRSGKVKQYAIVSLHPLDQHISHPRSPPGLERRARRTVQPCIRRHAVKVDGVQRTDETIEKGHYRQVFLRKGKVPGRETLRLQVLVCLPMECEHGRDLAANIERPEALPVLHRYGRTAMEKPCNVGNVVSCHFIGNGVCLFLEQGC